MNHNDLLNLGTQYRQQGRIDMAIETWMEATRRFSEFTPAYFNLFLIFKETNNPQKAHEALNRWFDCPLSARMIDMVPKLKEEMVALEKTLGITK